MIGSVLATMARLVSGAQVCWAGCRPTTRRRIYFANHTSHLDFLVIWAALPAAARARTRPVAAHDYWARGRLRRLLAERVFRAILVERRREGPNDALDRMLAALDEGCSLILFPEGTRGRGDGTAPFRSGLYNLGRLRPEVELVPVYLENLGRVLPKGEFLPVPLRSRVVFGPPLRVEDGETREGFLERARNAVQRLADP
jgi:1-acyl-sn-glycerol-3-phosphate acyltransferase